MSHQKKLLGVAVAIAFSSGAFAQSVQVKQIEAQKNSTPVGTASAVTLTQNSQPDNNAVATQNINAQPSDPLPSESNFGTWSVSGMLRQEAAVKTTANQNMMNQGGNVMNGVNYVSNNNLLGYLSGAPTVSLPVNLTRPASFSKK